MKNTPQKLKVLRYVPAEHYFPNRSALPKPAAYFLMHFRSCNPVGEFSKPRLSIPVLAKKGAGEAAQAVRITHRQVVV